MLDLCFHMEPVWTEEDPPDAVRRPALDVLLYAEGHLSSLMIFRTFSCPLEMHLYRARHYTERPLL